MTDSIKTNRLLGKLLLPGYTDAGANTSFQPTTTTTTATTPVGPASEAATEIRDNRSYVKQQFRMNASRNYEQQQMPGARIDSLSEHSSVSSPQRRQEYLLQESTTTIRKAAFFPLTMPQKSPTPTSPPQLTREPIPAGNVIPDSSMVSETLGRFPFSDEETSSTRLTNRSNTNGTSNFSLEKENQKRMYYWQSEGGGDEGPSSNSTNSNGKSMTLNAANLRQVDDSRTRRTPSPENSSSSTDRRNQDRSSIRDDEMSSDVMSTASEMGTVIDVGNRAARMAEIDAMAALLESSPNMDIVTPRQGDIFPQPPSQTPNRRGGTATDTISDLAMPVLDAQNRSVKALAPQQRTRGEALSLASPVDYVQDHHQYQEQQRTVTVAINNFPTPTEMLTSALRRLGTGISKTKASLSAPPTPRSPEVPPAPRVEELLRSSTSHETGMNAGDERLLESNYDGDLLPASLALRSPGSSARLSLRRKRQHDGPVLAPRFSPHHNTSERNGYDIGSGVGYDSTAQQRTTTVKSLPSSLPTLSTPLRLNPVSPFRLAQQCLSYNSTLDELEEIHSATGSGSSSSNRHVLNLESFPMRTRSSDYVPKTSRIPESMSWDVTSSSTSSAFRTEPHRSHRIGGLTATPSQMERNAQRLRIPSDFSPRHGTITTEERISGGGPTTTMTTPSDMNDQRNILKLRTPERFHMDVEREDALDILACLVERGVAAWSEEPPMVNKNNNSNPNDSMESVSQTREALVSAVIEDLQTIAEKYAECEKGEIAAEQIDALEELLKAHSYALEMKRASLSASSWLRSIGRDPSSTSNSNDRYLPTNSSSTISNNHFPMKTQDARYDTVHEEEEDDDPNPSTTNSFYSTAATAAASALSDVKLEMLTLKARLHSAENELKEKTIVNQKLDEELFKCRVEIGRLRTVTTKNEEKSMIDDDMETTETGRSMEDDAAEVRDHPSPTRKPLNGGIQSKEEGDDKFFDESFQGDNSLFQDVSTSAVLLDDNNNPQTISKSQDTINLELVVLKTALNQANDTIRLLHEKLYHETPLEERDEAPIVDILGDVGRGEVTKSSTSAAKPTEQSKDRIENGEDRQTINVRMLNGENFVTEWGNLTAPLPPPPDHGLRSPIIDAVLDQWTDDQNLHDSLLTWMERVMTGDNLEETVPPLTISSLDHQVRDGFVMHLLPLLLRRADIHVVVQTRAHRTTSYDLAVSVHQTRNSIFSSERHLDAVGSPSLLDQQNSDDQDHQPAATMTTPRFSGKQGGNKEDATSTEYTHFEAASEDMDDTVPPSFMGAIGGAIGGLLSRGRNTLVQSPARSHNAGAPTQPTVQPSTPVIMPTMSSGSHHGSHHGPSSVSSSSNTNHNNRVELDNQPYHRVVSAPPGRIGITFVEYRGHAMVADMAADSPLSSWIFPSDILIAVDEIPVSGMRIREIIKILTQRKDRQRALRVISSHAMNEFTLNQSISLDVLAP